MLQINGLHAGYGKLEILHGIDLTVSADTFTTILGPNGSGKSTLLKSIFGLCQIFSGAITINAATISGLPTELIGRHGIAYVPQRLNIFTALTVQENLAIALRNVPTGDRKSRRDAAYARFPVLAKRLQQRAGQLSGGERQMLAVAIGWLAGPQLMLLDEPTAGLSPLLTQELFKTLTALHQDGMALLVVEQNARTALTWSRATVILREGQIAYAGDSESLRTDDARLTEYLGAGLSSSAVTRSESDRSG
ncbi:MAG: ABC transporter ATP-binding protein [Chloroflexi bacterium]|nr:ABC transporter ATP-binding protein [Chloroflexota bacterium]